MHAGALVPAAYLGWAAWQGLFRVDPVREMTTLTGKTALVLPMLSLACTPIYTLKHTMPQTLALVSLLVREYDETLSVFIKALRFQLVQDTPPGDGKR